MIHSSSVIDKKAEITDKVNIGPFCYVGPNVKLKDGVELISNVHIEGNTEIGRGTKIFPFASIGTQPQDLKFKGEKNNLIIGENKPSYNESDHEKLKKIRNSFNFNEKAQEIVNNFFKSKKIPYSKILRIDFFLGFKESKIKPLDYVKFFNVRDNGQVLMLEN